MIATASAEEVLAETDVDVAGLTVGRDVDAVGVVSVVRDLEDVTVFRLVI